jgi:outer membrane protein insertion porin family
MRQLESEVYKVSKVDRSRIRLQRLNYLTSVDIKTVPVEGHDDLLDLEVTVAERFSGNFQIGLGFSATQGLILNLGVTHDNIFGTGRTLSFTFDNSQSSQRYGFRYLNPYYTANGVSRGFRFTYTATDAAELNVSDYLIDRTSLSMDYGIPVSEFNTFTIEFGAEQNNILTTPGTPDEIIEFIIANSDEYDENTDPADVTGAKFNTLFSRISFSKDTRNRRVFADTGSLNTVGFEVDAGDLDFYKLRYQHRTAFPLVYNTTYNFRSRIGYGDSYAETTELPFFERFYAGGVRSVRAYERNSLGPLDSNGNPFGGTLQVIFSSELLIPLEAIASSETFRLGLYFDVGNVFDRIDTFDVAELRGSVGISAKWFSVVGPLEFSLGYPVNDQPGDDIRNFQFALGASF